MGGNPRKMLSAGSLRASIRGDGLIMENEITFKDELAPGVKLIKVRAPLIAKKARSGQFVILRASEDGERIPLTLIDWDPKEGTITLVFREVGASTKELGRLEVGDAIHDLVGPLGRPGEVAFYGRACVIGGGVAIAAAYERAKSLKEAGNSLTAIIGARTAGQLIFKDQLRKVVDRLYTTTDDGSEGVKGSPSDLLRSLLESGERFDLVFAVGPEALMKSVSEATRPYNIKTIVSLNSLMVDGTGMCGCCRVTVGGRTMFTCVDGPEFDAHLVDFDELMARLRMYEEEERLALKVVGRRCRG
jgi:ferredoxin--NADP+ reductase